MSDNFKVLIGYDGSNFADAALDDLTNAGLPEDTTEVLVISVAEVWLPPSEEPGQKPEFVTAALKKKYEENVEILAKARERASRAAERLKLMFPGWTIAAEATYGSPAWEILFRASDFAPDLIVVGSQGYSAFERVLMGSISQKIVAEAHCSVRVGRGQIEVEDAPTRLVLGYDGSAGADEMVKSVLSRSWKPGSEIKILIVQDTVFIRNSLDMTIDKFEEAGRRIVGEFDAKGVKSSLAVKEGNPKRVLIEEAESWGADCIFVGAAKFRNSLSKHLLGSVSSAVVSRAPCSVEVVRTPGYEG